MKDIMRKKGILHELRRKGARVGSIVIFGKRKTLQIVL